MDKIKKIYGVVLAAGESKRMGFPKQLIKIGDRTLLQWVLNASLSSRLDKVILVLGYMKDEILRSLGTFLEDPKLMIIENSRYREGMGVSISCAMGKIKDRCQYVMILLGDMPFVREDIIDRLIEAYLLSGKGLGAIVTDERQTHPVIIRREYFPYLLSLQGDKGARELFKNNPDDLFTLYFPFDSTDIDTPQDLHDLNSCLKK